MHGSIHLQSCSTMLVIKTQCFHRYNLFTRDGYSRPAPERSQVVVVGDRRTRLEARRAAPRCRGRACEGGGGWRQQQEAARVRKSRLPSRSRKQLCFCLIQSQSLYRYLYFSLIIIPLIIIGINKTTMGF